MKLFLTVLLVFVIVDVLIVIYVIYRRKHKRLPKNIVEEIRSTWKEIIRQQDHRHAIMDADKLLDYTLTQLGVHGNLGSKLKQSSHRFSSINDVWAAHKVRNNIAHQINYRVTPQAYKKAMLGFKQAFMDLKLF